MRMDETRQRSLNIIIEMDLLFLKIRHFISLSSFEQKNQTANFIFKDRQVGLTINIRIIFN